MSGEELRRRQRPGADRGQFLHAVSEVDPEEYSFTRNVGDQMRQHDDREQFLAGVDLVLAGITALHPPSA